MSDIHLTDGTSGKTIKSGAFKKFSLFLEDMIGTATAKELEIVFLGDIFDVIRSDYWLNSSIRPWSGIDDKDGQGKGLKDYAGEIVGRICNNSENKASVDYLRELQDKMVGKGMPLKITYVVGNHDWLINRYPETRVAIAKFLGMDDPDRYQEAAFPTEWFWEKYRAFARHGDIYDPFNFDGRRDASSLGDAIVIDLVNRFPKAVEDAIGSAEDPDLISQLREIDNVRPLVDIPSWIQGACRGARSVEIGEKVKEIWNDLVDYFLKIEFVKQHDRPWRLDAVDALQWGLRISKHLPLKEIANLPLRKFHRSRTDYTERAYREEHVRRNEAEFVLYGHTHNYEIQPLDNVPMAGESKRKTYFNTGTWRLLHVRTAYDTESQEFQSWNVMTFITLYLNGERENREFEVWHGALG